MLQKLTIILSFLSLTACTVSTPATPTVSGEVSKHTSQKLELVDIGTINNGQTMGSGDVGYYADYPIFTGSMVSYAIRDWLDSEVKKFESEAKEAKTYLEDIKPEFSAVFDIHTGADLTAVTYEIYTWAGGAHGQDTSRSFVIDGAGKGVKFSDLFINYDANLGAIRSAITESVKKSGTGIFDLMDDGIDEYLRDPNFSLSGSTVIMMFQKYQVAPGSEGLQYIPLTASGLLREKVQGSFEYTGAITPVETIQPSPVSLDTSLIDQALAAEGTKYVALTFDDGPSKAQTPRLLDILAKNNIKATFYVLGKNTSFFPSIVSDAYRAGHEIGSHSWDHPQLTRLSRAQLQSQASRTDAAIKSAIGVTPATMRPPYGSYNQAVKDVFARPIILWNVDTLDWKYREVGRNVKVATSQASDGAIILFHDIHATSVSSIDTIVKNLKSRGYVFVTISELLKIKNGGKSVTGAKVCTSGGSCR